MRRGEPRKSVNSQNAQLPEYGRNGELPIPRPGHLVPPSEKAAHRMIQMQLHIVARLRQRSVAEVGRPAPHGAVQTTDHLRPRRMVTGPKPSPDRPLDGGNGLL